MAVFAHAETTTPSIDDTMVVTASRFEQPVSTVLAPISVLTRSDLEELQAKSLVDALKTLPGVEIGQNGGRGQNASIFLRGTESNHVLVLVDGVRLPRTMMGSVDFNMLPLSSVERIEVVRGSGATVYGSDAIGGVINIITRNNVESKRFGLGAGSDGFVQANAGVTTQVSDSVSLQLAGGFEKTDGYNVHPEYAAPGTEHGFESKNLSARVGIKSTENVTSNVIARWFQNDVDYDGFGSKKRSWIENTTFGADTGIRAGNSNTLLRIEVGEQSNYDYFDGASKTDADLTSKIRQVYGSVATRFQVSEDVALTGGLDSSWEKYLKGNFISVENIVDNPRQNIGAFVLANWNVSDSVLLEGSLRHDENDQFGGNGTGLIALGWSISSDYRVFSSYGTAFKAPGFDSLYGTGGNTTLKPEESENLEIGVEGTTYNVGWSANGYITKIDNLIMYTGSWPTGTNENIEEAEIRGVELMANFDIGPVYNQVSLDLKDPKDVSKDEQLARRAKQVAKWRTSVWVKDVLLGTQYQYQSERLDFSGGDILGSYSLWDFTAQYDVNSHVTLRGKVANVFDKEYETAGGYPALERSFYVNLDFVF